MTSEAPVQNTSPRFTDWQRIGEGAYGVVFLAHDQATRRPVALKRLELDSDLEGIPATTMREVSTLRLLQHPNIVQLVDVIINQSSVYIVFEFVDYDLKRLLDSLPPEQGLDSLLAKKFMYQLALSISFCHSHRIFHRDLKPQNLLIDRFGCLKLADFGLARSFSPSRRNYSPEVLTLWYRAPEILLGCADYSTAVDMWSVGCIYYEIITRNVLFPGDTQIDQLFKIFSTLGTPSEQTWPGVTTLPDFSPIFPNWDLRSAADAFQNCPPDFLPILANLVVCNPGLRMPATSLLELPYFADFVNQDLSSITLSRR